MSFRGPIRPWMELELTNQIASKARRSSSDVSYQSYRLWDLYLLFTNWVQGPYQEIQALGFSYSPSLRGLFGKPRACIFWYGTSTQLVNSLLYDPF